MKRILKILQNSQENRLSPAFKKRLGILQNFKNSLFDRKLPVAASRCSRNLVRLGAILQAYISIDVKCDINYLFNLKLIKRVIFVVSGEKQPPRAVLKTSSF